MDYKEIDDDLYEALAFSVASNLENSADLPYYDSRGLPTIGIGLLLSEESNRTVILDVLGLALADDATATEIAAYNELFSTIGSLAGDLVQNWNDAFGDYHEAVGTDPNTLPADGIYALLLEQQIEVYNIIHRIYEDSVSNGADLQGDDLDSGSVWIYNTSAQFPTGQDPFIFSPNEVPYSLERVAFVDMAYNGVTISRSPSLRNGAIEENASGLPGANATPNDLIITDAYARAIAYYEVGYNSNGGEEPMAGLAKRRAIEASIFGLYDEEFSLSDASTVAQFFNDKGEYGGGANAQDRFDISGSITNEVINFPVTIETAPGVFVEYNYHYIANGDIDAINADLSADFAYQIEKVWDLAAQINTNYSLGETISSVGLDWDGTKLALYTSWKAVLTAQEKLSEAEITIAPDLDADLNIDFAYYQADDELDGQGNPIGLAGEEDESNYLFGGRGENELTGGSESDVLLGFRGEDTLLGDAGDDALFGGRDDDTLIGGVGDDYLHGGILPDENEEVPDGEDAPDIGTADGTDTVDYSQETVTNGVFVMIDREDLSSLSVLDTFGDTDTLVSIERVIGTSEYDDGIYVESTDTLHGVLENRGNESYFLINSDLGTGEGTLFEDFEIVGLPNTNDQLLLDIPADAAPGDLHLNVLTVLSQDGTDVMAAHAATAGDFYATTLGTYAGVASTIYGAPGNYMLGGASDEDVFHTNATTIRRVDDGSGNTITIEDEGFAILNSYISGNYDLLPEDLKDLNWSVLDDKEVWEVFDVVEDAGGNGTIFSNAVFYREEDQYLSEEYTEHIVQLGSSTNFNMEFLKTEGGTKWYGIAGAQDDGINALRGNLFIAESVGPDGQTYLFIVAHGGGGDGGPVTHLSIDFVIRGFTNGDFGINLQGFQGDDEGDSGDDMFDPGAQMPDTGPSSLLNALSLNDRYDGGGGNDQIHGRDGDDTLFGGAGEDLIYGGDDDDYLSGGLGTDTLNGDGGQDYLFGEAGADTLNGGADDDYLDGGDGIDTLDGGDGRDELRGGNDDDDLFGGGAADTLYGDEGNDYIRGASGDDTLYGGNGDDELRGGYGDDILHGGAGNDFLFGEDGQDALYGDEGDDTLSGGPGQETLYGGAGNDSMNGGLAIDILYGGDGNDHLAGEGGDDELYGDAGEDQLLGGDGGDILDGGADFDRLNGEAGNDILTGGSGADWFIVSTAQFGNDRVTDFENGSDKIVFRSSTGVTSMGDIIDIRQAYGDVVIETAAGNIRLENTDLADVDSSDFLFTG